MRDLICYVIDYTVLRALLRGKTPVSKVFLQRFLTLFLCSAGHCPAEPLDGAHETLKFRGTPAEKKTFLPTGRC